MAAKELDLGPVRGRDATINGQSAIELVGGKNIDITQSGSTVTVSPAKIRIMFIRILPDTCAVITCLFVNSTLKL